MQRSRSSAISGEIGIGLSKVRFANCMRVVPGPKRKVRSCSGHSPPLSQSGQSSGWFRRMNSRIASWPSEAFSLVSAVLSDEAVRRRQRARGLELRQSLHLAEAHAAGPDRRPEPRLVAEDRDLDPDRARRSRPFPAPWGPGARWPSMVTVTSSGWPVRSSARSVTLRAPRVRFSALGSEVGGGPGCPEETGAVVHGPAGTSISPRIPAWCWSTGASTPSSDDSPPKGHPPSSMWRWYSSRNLAT